MTIAKALKGMATGTTIVCASTVLGLSPLLFIGEYVAPINSKPTSIVERFVAEAARLVAKTKHNFMNTFASNYHPPLPLMKKNISFETDGTSPVVNFDITYGKIDKVYDKSVRITCNYADDEYRGYFSYYDQPKKIADYIIVHKPYDFLKRHTYFLNAVSPFSSEVSSYARKEEGGKNLRVDLGKTEVDVISENVDATCRQLEPVVQEIMATTSDLILGKIYPVSTKYSDLGKYLVGENGEVRFNKPAKPVINPEAPAPKIISIK